MIGMLDTFASKLVAENEFIKASFGGFAGTGKTTTASRFIAGFYKDFDIKKPLLFIDNEKGSRFLVPFFKENGIECYVKQTVSLADIFTSFDMLNDGEIGCLFIDSMTKIWYKFVRDYQDKNRKTFMTLQDWGKVIPNWQEQFNDKFVQANGNIIFTGRGGFTYEMEEDDRGKKQFVKSGVKVKMQGDTPYEPDLNIWMDVSQEIDSDGNKKIWREAMVMKDRSSLIDGKTFINPSYKDFQPVVKYLKSVEKGEVSKESDNTNLAPYEEWDDKKKAKAKLLEEINGELEAHYPGVGKAEKVSKAGLKKHLFGTYSDTEIQSKSVLDLETSLNKLRDLFVDENWEQSVKSIIDNIVKKGK
jgi:hypothetical protein